MMLSDFGPVCRTHKLMDVPFISLAKIKALAGEPVFMYSTGKIKTFCLGIHMNRTFEIYPEKKLIVARFTGPIDYQDILNWFEDALQHEAFSKDYDGIVDLRKAAVQEARPEKAKLLASYIIEHDFTKGKWAILVSKPMETALSLLYANVATRQHPVESFSTIEAAASFLAKDLDGIDFGLKDYAV
jgi:hypothetical protein